MVEVVFGTMLSVTARSRIFKLIDRISASQRTETATEDMLGTWRAEIASIDRDLPGPIRDFCQVYAPLFETRSNNYSISEIYCYTSIFTKNIKIYSIKLVKMGG